MQKRIVAVCLSLLMAFCMSQAAYAASDIGIKLVGQKEDLVHTPVVVDDLAVFPLKEILAFLDPSGTETVVWDETPPYSIVSFQGECFKITQGLTEVQEYELDEYGACVNATGKLYQLESPATYLDDYKLGIFVPLSFISDIVANSKYGKKFQTHYTEDGNLEFSLLTRDGTDIEQIANPVTLAMQINNPWLLTEDDGQLFDGSDHSVSPIVKNGSTLLPIGPIIEQLGGSVSWNNKERKVTIKLNKNTIELWIDSKSANVNGLEKTLDVPPTVIKGRTMLPVRFVTENLRAKVAWDGEMQMVLIYNGGAESKESDWLVYGYKLALLDGYQKQEDNRQNLADAVEDIRKEHDKIQYNDSNPLDYSGKLVHVGDTVGLGTFSGTVKKISGAKILVYWNHASFIVEKGKEQETAKIFGIEWLTNQWMEAKYVTIES
ncbi:stalk domain-containing protein [Paenibacillus sp. ISL-20]|uniref:stalk domain-containing protein n=1 Tax=Paenibacillus sp. ISL-20 TaxID=2819163 RepID=UPI001BEC1195|nr:stalk domain-containing protein [Paenibacillus sp. ISL-20]MBT2762406.1 copper amine oxidase N-terminal domain-containing protein [Paenibacillus sp. ISL-20]